MSGHNALQSTFESAQKSLQDFITAESTPSEAELLDQAFENAAQNKSSVKDEFHGQTLSAFSAWHRTLNGCYTVTDIDWVYYRPNSDEIYLIVENKCVTTRPFNAETVVDVQPSDFQRSVLQRLGKDCDSPVYLRWWREEDGSADLDKADQTHETCYVRKLDSDETPRKLNGKHEHMDWLDEHRPDAAGGDR